MVVAVFFVVAAVVVVAWVVVSEAASVVVAGVVAVVVVWAVVVVVVVLSVLSEVSLFVQEASVRMERASIMAVFVFFHNEDSFPFRILFVHAFFLHILYYIM